MQWDWLQKKALFTFAPLDTDAIYRLSPDGEPPRWSLMLPGQHLSWRIRPAPRQTYKLTEGDLKDTEGHVSISVGTATLTGGASFGDAPRLGVLAWRDDDYFLNLAVSPDTFKRLLDWCQQGKIPVLQVELIPYLHKDDAEPPTDALGKGYLDLEWDNAKHRHLEISWFQFEWPLNTPESANLDEVFASQPVSAKLFSQGINKLHDVIRSVKLLLWILCFFIALEAIF